MPQIISKMMEHCQTDEIDMAGLAELIAKDAGMAARIMEAANSSASHRNARSANLEQALGALGASMVKTMVISESVAQVFDNSSRSSGADLRSFWKHSFASAVAARMIAAKIGYPHIEEAYLAGLLHDIGRLALFAAVPEEYASGFLARDDESLCALEQRTLQITHPAAGASMIERWNLDSFLADSVLYHHEPPARLEKAHPLIRIVFLAHRFAGHGQDDTELQAAASLCGIDAADLASIHGHATEQAGKAAEDLGIDTTDDGLEPASAEQATAPPAQDNARQKLTEQVRNLVLASEAGRSFGRRQGEAALLGTASRSARVLFNFADTAILLLNDTGHLLTGTSIGEHRKRLAEFSIPLGAGGAIAETALQRRVTFISRDGNLPGVAEEQLLRIFGTECLVCLPLVSEGRCLGVFIGGAASGQLADFRRCEGSLQVFAAQAAIALKMAASEQGEASRRIASVTEEYREASRRVAHEVNNPLSIIKNYLSVLDRKLAKQEPVSAEISILNEEIDRVGQIIGGLADLQPVSREGTAEVNRVISDVIRLFRDTGYVPASVRIMDRLQDQPFEIDSDGDTLKQIMVNLIKNAIEALPDGGEIEIGNNGLVNRDGLLYVEIWIKDTGLGISPEVMANLFSPVRSTKGEAHRGLGLSIVHGLVKKIHGLIICRSNKEGTAFEILLPVPSRTDQAIVSQSPARNSA